MPTMSDEQIPGVPKGFELVHASRIAEEGEWFIDNSGFPAQAACMTIRKVAVLKRIPKPTKRVLIYSPQPKALNEMTPFLQGWAERMAAKYPEIYHIEERDA